MSEHDDRPSHQILGHLWQVGRQQEGLAVWREFTAGPKEDDGWTGRSAAGEQGSEVGVRRDNNASVPSGTSENVLVGRPQHAKICYVHGVVASLTQARGDHR